MIKKLEIPSTEYMCETRFWNLVGMAKWPCDIKKMNIKYRKMLDKDECKAFRKTLGVAHNTLDAVITDMSLGVGDDSYGDLIKHIIGLGKKKYYEHLNNIKLVQERADTRNFEENFSYCIPYESDYEDSEHSKYDIKSVISITQHAKEEIERVWKLDKWKGVEHLFPIRDELLCLHTIMTAFFLSPSKENLQILAGERIWVTKYCNTIRKFFDDNYMELPRKFTEGNGFCTAIFENTINDAEILLEYLRTEEVA